MAQKSCINGDPNSAAADCNAETPGNRFHRRGLSIPLPVGKDNGTRARPCRRCRRRRRTTTATVLPEYAMSTASAARSSSLTQFHGMVDLARRLAGNLLDVKPVADQFVAIGNSGGGGPGVRWARVAGAKSHQVEFACVQYSTHQST